MTKLAMESILNKSPPYGSGVLVEQRLGDDANAGCHGDVPSSLEIGNGQNGKKESGMHHKKFHGLASRLGRAAAEYGVLVLGAVALELVILFSFKSSDGLFLILPALTVGTCVYIMDGRRNAGCDPIPNSKIA